MQGIIGRRSGRIAWLVLGIVLGLGTATRADAVGLSEDGCEFTPFMACASGEHRVAVRFTTQFRYERWDARAASVDGFLALRSRVSATYAWRDRLMLFAEGQHTVLDGLSAEASGAAALYRANTPGGARSSVDALALRQLWVEIRPSEALSLAVGRLDLNLGTLVTYPEANWNYVKGARLSQRLLGTVDWTHGARAFDGVSGVFAPEGYVLHLFAAEPTTGVFALQQGYERLQDVLVGGVHFTVMRGMWLEHTEFTGFVLGYADSRDPEGVAGLFGDIQVYTFGASLLGIYPLGPGQLDVALWGTFQLGEYTDATPRGVRQQEQRAWAFIGEVGYQLTTLPFSPWLRTGVNVASGDGDPNDGTHHTFFNILPTNHLYYGYTDQLAFQNLLNWFVQLKLSPLPRMGLELYVHRFWLVDDRDQRYFGTGAFNRSSLGFGSASSNASRDVGTEFDVVVSYRINRHLTVAAGYAVLWGGAVFNTVADRDTRWAFGQVIMTY